MHIHSAQASAVGNALAGAQDAETSMSLRRARELRDAATRLKAASFEIGANIPQGSESDPETAAQTVSMISAWAGGGSPSSQSGSSIQERSATDVPSQNAPPRVREVQRTPSSGPVSYWA